MLGIKDWRKKRSKLIVGASNTEFVQNDEESMAEELCSSGGGEGSCQK